MKTAFLTSFSSRTPNRNLLAPRPAWVFAVVGVCTVVFGLRLWLNTKYGEFLNTASPNNTYTVVLKGDRGRPWIIPSKVRADVFKLGQPFISDIQLHSTNDLFDLSFEAGFPNVRWLGDRTVEFYRAQHFEYGADALVVSNRAASSIQYLRVQAENKFLLFDMQAGATVSLEIPAPRGDWQDIALEGAFTGGQQIKFSSNSFERRSTQRKRSVYQIIVEESGSIIEAKGMEQPK